MSVSKTKRFNESKSEEKNEMAANPQHAQKNIAAAQQPQARAPQQQQQQQRQQQPQQQQKQQQQQPQRQDNQDVAAPSAPPAGQVEDIGGGGSGGDGANAPRSQAQGEHDLHSPLDRMSRASSQERAPSAEDQYDVSARDVEGIRLNRFDNNMLHSANVAFMGMLSSAYQMFNQYVAPLVRPLYKTITMDGRLWKVMRQGFTNTADWLFANRQEIGGYLGYMKSLLFTIIKFAVGAIALLISTIGRAAGFFKDAQQVGRDRVAPEAQAPVRNDNQQQPQQQRRSGGSSAGGGSISGADIAAPLLENAVSAAGKGVGMLFGAARGLFNSDVARVFKDFLTQGKAEEYVPRRDGQDARAQANAHNA